MFTDASAAVLSSAELDTPDFQRSHSKYLLHLIPPRDHPPIVLDPYIVCPIVHVLVGGVAELGKSRLHPSMPYVLGDLRDTKKVAELVA